MTSEKTKMSNSKYRKIFIPTVSVVLILCIVVSVGTNYFAASLDTYLGRGEIKLYTPEGSKDWDTEYYNQKFENTSATDGSVSNGAKINKEVADEGFVLMKNNGVLPLSKDTGVTPFGYRFISPVYGGGGSGNVDTTKDYIVTADEALKHYFKVNTDIIATMNNATPKEITTTEVKDYVKQKEAEVGKGFAGSTVGILEFDPAIYKESARTYQNDTGIVFLGRIGGEGGNLQSSAYADGTEHALQLTPYELDTIKFAKANTKKVVAIINSSNVMELGPLMSGEYEVDAIVWIGGPGSTGFASLADILVGVLNPSGRTADVWDADLLANPTMVNFSQDRTYSNTVDTKIASNYKGLYFIEYEEGIFYGYRYYETAYDVGSLDYDKAVVFPFGYGLSYTSFEQSITSLSSSGDDIKVKVQVKNTGDVDGKEVIQLYYTPPYTEYDAKNKIEKSTKNLVAFDKVDLKAGETKEVEITFAKEDMASYDNTRDNGDGTTGSWMLEEGDYVVNLSKNSHEAWGTKTVKVDSTIWYDKDNVKQSEQDMQSALDDKGNPLGYPDRANQDKDAKFIAASNQFDESSKYMNEETVPLSRADWNGTQPTMPEEKALSAERLEKASNFDLDNDPLLGNNKDSVVYAEKDPVSKASNGLVLSNMRGKSYYDPTWEKLLDQIDYSSPELSQLLFVSAFTTGKLSSIGKPDTIDHDGPAGFNLTGAEGGPLTTAYTSEVVLASTWNQELAYKFGESIGQEALVIGYHGWYGPGLNNHRSPFNGRNFEYYSEDPLLSGKFAAGVVSGAGDQGVVSYIKHFALNDYEGPSTALATWATEQTIREIYLKPYEIALKDSRMTIKYISDNEGTVSTKVMRANTALMAAANMISGEWAAANYKLLNNVLRGEWGYQGLVTTDMFLQNTPNITDKVFRAGSDLKMWFMPTTATDTTSATAKTAYRRAIKNVSYAYVNSNLMQGAQPGAIISYSTSPWKMGVWAFDIVGGAFILLMIIVMIRRTKDAKRNPEKYKGTLSV